MSRRKTVFYGMVLFLSGVLVGAVSLHVAFRYHMLRHFQDDPRAMTAMVMKRLQHELKLSPAQSAGILPIIEDTHNQLENLRRENQPRMESMLDDAVHKAFPVLSPEQQTKLLQLEVRVKNHFEKRQQHPE